IDIRQKLVQRRIQQTNGDGEAGHLAEDPDKVATLQREKLVQSFFTRANAVGENHLAHRGESLIAEEHVFGAAQSDAFSTKAARGFRIERSVAVSAHTEATELVRPLHQLMKIGTELRLNRRHSAEKDAAGRSVNCDPFAFGDYFAIDGELLLAVIDIDR